MKPRACLVAAGLLTTAAHGELLAWLDFGPDLAGESADPGHEGWAAAFAFDVGHVDGKLTLTCRRRIDKASPLLMQAACGGRRFEEVRLDLARVDGKGPVEFWQVVFRGVEPVGYAHASTPDDPLPSEEISFRWKSLVSTYHVFPPGEASYPITAIISADGDRDTLPDAYEEAVGLDPRVSNEGLDTDGDGLTDTDEYRLGTGPTDPTSFFRVVARVNGPDSMELTWPSVAGESYRIDFSPDLMSPFNPVADVTATGAETRRTVDRIPPVGFFRVRKDLP